MAEIQPFRAYRYDPGRVGSFADVIAPPYDVIDDALRSRLMRRHPNNVVIVDLPRPEPGDGDANTCYQRAGRTLKDWVRDGILKQDSARSLYVYNQEFEAEGRRHVRRGFLARVRVQPFSHGTILPHEETFAGPKADRLRLMEATGMNLSPVFGLYSDAGREVQSLLDAATAGQPPAEATDDLGVVGRLWPVSDQHVISQVAGLMGPRTVLIADGHHRYETSVAYRDGALGAEVNQQGDEPARYTLMHFVAMQDPGLIVLPTHRLVRGVGRLDAAGLTRALEAHFSTQPVDSPSAAWDQLSIEVGQGGLGFGLPDGTWAVARPKDLSIMAELAPDHGRDWRTLSVSVLHRLVLGRLLRPTGVTFEIDYVHLLGESADALAANRCELAVLVPASTVAEVESLAAQKEKMPQKSTYFYPKLQTGFVFNPLTTN
jgi:uncharacterized protein (DUF1015 family)